MRKAIKAWVRPSEPEFEELWGTATFVLDANILLHTYRYSASTSNELLSVFQAINERLWIPHQFTIEFARNRVDVIQQEVQRYEEVLKKLEEVRSQFDAKRGHPFLDKAILEEFSAMSNRLRGHLTSTKDRHEQLLTEDHYLRRMLTSLDGRVGHPYPEAALLEIHKEAQRRYDAKIPPGFQDKKPAPDRYGDYIGWRQILDFASEEQIQAIILITDDKKEDWWSIKRGRTIGPLPELLAEFHSHCGKDLYFYTMEQFLGYASKHLGADVSQAAIAEARELGESNLSSKSDGPNEERSVSSAADILIDTPKLSLTKSMEAEALTKSDVDSYGVLEASDPHVSKDTATLPKKAD